MDESGTPPNRRTYSRVNVPLSVVLHTSLGPVNGEIWDVGPGGAFILCEGKPAIGETVGIVFTGGQIDDSVTIKGSVVRSTMEGVGVQFVGLSDGEQRFLNQVVTDSFRVEFGKRFVRKREAVDRSNSEGTDETFL
ncbi:MAG TPA: PilZ domain-containing protein [Syntrophobacteria bacterium]|nr:PilZ domain-containing protein [Syntrophobacteria bacterium]